MKIRQRRKDNTVYQQNIINMVYNDLINYKPYSLTLDGITQSLLANWTCRVKFCLACQGYTVGTNKIKKTTFGSICHAVCEEYYKYKILLDFVDILTIINSYIRKDRSNYIDWEEESLIETKKVAAIVMEKYCKYYLKDMQKMVIEPNNVEYKFKQSFLKYCIKGKTDLIFRYGNSSPMLMEHKFMGSIREDVLKSRLMIDRQNLFYINGLDSQFKINDVIYDIIRKPQLVRKSLESINEFCERISMDIDKRPEFYFIRLSIHYSEKEIKEFQRQLILKLTEIEAFLQGSIPVYRNESACELSSNGIPYLCEFINVCNRDDISELKKEKIFKELQ